MIITIDGPAGAGKSSAAKALAERLGYDFLDTGAMYRAVTLAGLRAGIDLRDQQALAQLLDHFQLEMPSGKVILNGEDISAAIRTAEVSESSSPVAESPVVRRHLVDLQKRVAGGRNIVSEGRDQGTVVFPDAACKFFLMARPQERARRRHQEIQARGENASLEDILKSQEERDRRDASRDLSPMKPAVDALLLDSTDMTLDQVVGLMEREVCERMKREGC